MRFDQIDAFATFDLPRAKTDSLPSDFAENVEPVASLDQGVGVPAALDADPAHLAVQSLEASSPPEERVNGLEVDARKSWEQLLYQDLVNVGKGDPGQDLHRGQGGFSRSELSFGEVVQVLVREGQFEAQLAVRGVEVEDVRLIVGVGRELGGAVCAENGVFGSVHVSSLGALDWTEFFWLEHPGGKLKSFESGQKLFHLIFYLHAICDH